LGMTQSSREVEVVTPIDPVTLVVPGRLDPKRNRRSILDDIDRDEEAPIEFHAVRGERINFIRRVSPPAETFRGAPRTDAVDRHDSVPACRPLTLHAHQRRPQIEDQVVSLIPERPENADSELDGFCGNACLRDGSFLIRCHIRQRSDCIGWAVAI
jgi:hypothetical protein